MSESLNEEQTKTAKKEAGDFCFPVYTAELKDVDPKADKRTIAIEAERWVDARAFALRKLGVPEAVIVPAIVNGSRPIPRWQVRWAGSAAGANTLRMQARLIQNEEPDLEKGWRDVREL